MTNITERRIHSW